MGGGKPGGGGVFRRPIEVYTGGEGLRGVNFFCKREEFCEWLAVGGPEPAKVGESDGMSSEY